MKLFTRSQLKMATIEAVVIRANGDTEDKGVISVYRGSFLARWRSRIKMLAFATSIVLAFVFAHPLAVLSAGPFFMNAGKGITTSALVSSTAKYCAMGTGAGPSASTGTALSTEVETRGVGAQTQQTVTTTSDTYRVVGTVTATTARAITECGLFDASTVGNMLIGSGISTINLANGDAITFTYNLTFS